MASIRLTVVTPNGKPFEGEVERVIVRSTGGDVCIMARHIDYVTTLATGEGRFTMTDGKVRRVNLSGGMLHASNDDVHIITNGFAWKE